MTNWLHVATGPHRLLLNADRILEVIPCQANDVDPGLGFHPWRDRNVPVLDARSWLNLPARDMGSEAVQILCLQEADHVVMVVCDTVLGLIRAEESGFSIIPPFGGRFSRCFDRVLPGLHGEFSLRCRHPLPEEFRSTAAESLSVKEGVNHD